MTERVKLRYYACTYPPCSERLLPTKACIGSCAFLNLTGGQPMINVDCPVCGSESKKRTSRHYSDRSKMSYVVCLHEDCQCVFTTFEVFDRFITKTIDPAQLPAPVEKQVNEGVRQKAPGYTVRLE